MIIYNEKACKQKGFMIAELGSQIMLMGMKSIRFLEHFPIPNLLSKNFLKKKLIPNLLTKKFRSSPELRFQLFIASPIYLTLEEIDHSF